MNRGIGGDNTCYVIAEAGVNHNGRLDLARDLVDVAVEAGADAIKFQTFSVDRLVTEDTTTAGYQQRSGNTDQYEMLSELSLSHDDFRDIASYCEKQGIEFLSTPYDRKSVEFLDSLGVDRFKVASADIVNKPLLERIAATGKQVILSSGMTTLEEIAQGIDWVHQAGANDVVLLQCVSEYPADPSDQNLRVIGTFQEVFDVPVGFSDHTLGLTAAITAVSLGAEVVEKHFTLDKNMEGPDHEASLEPNELSELVDSIRKCERARGKPIKQVTDTERQNAATMRRSLHTSVSMEAGDLLTEETIAVVRPADGLAARHLDTIIGSTVSRNIPAGEPLTWEVIA